MEDSCTTKLIEWVILACYIGRAGSCLRALRPSDPPTSKYHGSLKIWLLNVLLPERKNQSKFPFFIYLIFHSSYLSYYY